LFCMTFLGNGQFRCSRQIRLIVLVLMLYVIEMFPDQRGSLFPNPFYFHQLLNTGFCYLIH